MNWMVGRGTMDMMGKLDWATQVMSVSSTLLAIRNPLSPSSLTDSVPDPDLS